MSLPRTHDHDLTQKIPIRKNDSGFRILKLTALETLLPLICGQATSALVRLILALQDRTLGVILLYQQHVFFALR